MAQLTPQGYDLKTQNEWFAEEQALYRAIDPLWPIDPSDPDGLKIAHDAEIFSALDETLLQAYNSKDPNKANGIDLDIVSSLTGTTRSKGTPSDVTLVFSGTPGSIVLADATIESATTGSRWTVPQAYTIDVGGTASVPARAINNGQTQAEPNTLTRIITTMAGITAVTNPSPATPGTDVESNSSLRIKRRSAVGRPGNNQVSAMLGELFATPGVRRARIYENPTGSAAIDPVFNPYGLPPHSTASLVDGGEDDDVAYSLYVKKNPGHTMAGVATVVDVLVTDPDYPTNKQTIRFNRPTYIDMVLVIEITDAAESLPENVSDLIKQAFMDYANGTLTSPSCGFRTGGFDIGESVPYSSMYTPINKVIGQYGNAYVSALTLNGATVNKVINYNQLSRWTEANITVTVV